MRDFLLAAPSKRRFHGDLQQLVMDESVGGTLVRRDASAGRGIAKRGIFDGERESAMKMRGSWGNERRKNQEEREIFF
ncbi:unnamed protein product [Linum trigynum]|uniref:Uncharacterized protein n=1 Tax=Linum trigynum TaxID=586398 RepID=A0AAV2CHX3_9ROSI